MITRNEESNAENREQQDESFLQQERCPQQESYLQQESYPQQESFPRQERKSFFVSMKPSINPASPRTDVAILVVCVVVEVLAVTMGALTHDWMFCGFFILLGLVGIAWAVATSDTLAQARERKKLACAHEEEMAADTEHPGSSDE